MPGANTGVSALIHAPWGGVGDRWWDPDDEDLCIWAAYQARGVGSFASSLIDRSGNGNHAGDPGGVFTPTWDAVNGWVFDGIQNYLTTTFVPQNDQSQTTLVQYAAAGVGNESLFGANNGAGGVYQIWPNRAVFNVRYANGGLLVVVPQLVAGNLGIAGNQGFRNGVPDGGALGVWSIGSALPIFIGAHSTAGGPANEYDGSIQALAIYTCVLTDAQVLAVAVVMATL